MSRTIIEVPMKTNNVDEVLNIVSSVFEMSGYRQKIVDGENIWSKGDGIIIGMQCFGVTFTSNSVLLQGWIKDAIIGETDLQGFIGALPKKKMKTLLENIKSTILAKKL